MRFTDALVRPPGRSLAQGLTTAGLGPPDHDRALEQHRRYCAALESAGLRVVRLAPDESHPDSTFVEDTAVVTPRGAILARPGAPSRRGEVASIRADLERLMGGRDLPLAEILPPGTLDGGDICDAGGFYFIGLSDRTNEDGAQQLASWLATLGYDSALVDIRGGAAGLHLKSGLACVAPGLLVVMEDLAEHPSFRGWAQVRVPRGEEYAANCLRVNQALLVAANHPGLEGALRARETELGCAVVALEMSEFRKLDGGLTCLSLRR